MTDHDLRAIYEFLSAIPRVEGPKAQLCQVTFQPLLSMRSKRCTTIVNEEKPGAGFLFRPLTCLASDVLLGG